MNKKGNLILWIVAIVLLITAASIVYAKYKPQGSVRQQQEEKTTESTSTTNNNKESDSAGSQTKEKTMAPDFNLKDMTGKDVKLSDYRGKIVILNFWAVWCGHCKNEMPGLNELNKELEKKNDVVLLAVDSQDSTKKVKEYLDSNKISLHVLLDSDGSVTKTYGVRGFPTTFVLNRDGSLFTYIEGETTKVELQDIISKMK